MAHMLTIKDLDERPEGTYYTGPLEEAKAFIHDWLSSTEARLTKDGQDWYSVLLAYSNKDGEMVTLANCDEYGNAPTLEEAWRYALGAEFGPADDEFSAFPLTHDKREAVADMVLHHFPQSLDAFYSPTSGLAMVEDLEGDMWQVFADGTLKVYRA